MKITVQPDRAVTCHHDDLILDGRDIRLMRAYLKWVDTARREGSRRGYYGPDWTPSDADIAKSRLFWWIRSGHEPLPYPPPRAYSCPWYEIVVETDRYHWAYELTVWDKGGVRTALVCQCEYEIISEQDGEYTIGFGPYRFRAFRDVDLGMKEMAFINEQVRQKALEECQNDLSKCWFLHRIDGINLEAKPC